MSALGVELRLTFTKNVLARNHNAPHVVTAGQLKHQVRQCVLHDRRQATGTGLTLVRQGRDLEQRLVRELQINAVKLEKMLVLAN